MEADMSNPNGVVITMDQIYSELQAVHVEVREMRIEVKSITDHENRLRALERKVWIAAGVAATVAGGIVQGLNSALGGA